MTTKRDITLRDVKITLQGIFMALYCACIGTLTIYTVEASTSLPMLLRVVLGILGVFIIAAGGYCFALFGWGCQ